MINKIKFNLYKWYKATDLPLVTVAIILYLLSLILVQTATNKSGFYGGINNNYLAIKQVVFVTISIIIILTCSSISKKNLLKISYFGFIITFISLILTIVLGEKILGARRWLFIANISYQPSEFLRPFFSVCIAKILSSNQQNHIKALISISMFLLLSIFLALQPDFSMLIIISLAFFAQIFCANIGYKYPAYLAILFLSIVIICSIMLPHVAIRIQNFLFKEKNNYQVEKSILSFQKGGFYGLGPGEGIIKKHLPDAHTDFIFSVLAEEFGILVVILILCMFLFFILRILLLVINEEQFVVISVVGMIMNIALQAMVNISVTLNLIPTTGITMPFISYGGSSSIATAISVAFILSLKKKELSLTRYRRHLDT